MAIKIFSSDIVLADNEFLRLGFDMGNREAGDYVPVFDRERALGILRSDPLLAARFLSQTKGNGTIFWSGGASSLDVGDGSAGVVILRKRESEEAQGDNRFGHFLEGVRMAFRQELSDIVIDEEPVRPGQVVCDFTRKGAFMSDIDERERAGDMFIHVDVYRPVRFRFDSGLNGTTGHAQRKSDDEVPFHRFVCPFGTSYPSPIIVGSAAEASILYEQAIRGDIDWKALFESLRERNLLDARLNAKQINNLISDYQAQFDWMRDQIVNNRQLHDMTIVGSSWMVPDGSMGRSVYDAQTAPSPAHVLARYINNPLLLFSSVENGVVRSLGMLDKDEPERFTGMGGGVADKPLNILVAGSDTIGGREPGRKATQGVVRKESLDESGNRVITAEKRFQIPMKSKTLADRDYAAFSARMDSILEGMLEGTPVRFVTGNVSSLGEGIGVGTPRMLERYVREHGGDVFKYDLVNKQNIPFGENKSEHPNHNLSVVLMENFGDCLPVLVGRNKSVEFRRDSKDVDSSMTFDDGSMVGDGLICFSSADDSYNRNVLGVASFAYDAGVPVVHVMDVMSEEAQRRFLADGALISRSGHPGDLQADGQLFAGELKTDWVLAEVNHLSSVDQAFGLHFPSVAEVYPSPVLVEGYSLRSALGAYVGLVASTVGKATPEVMKSIVESEGVTSRLMEVYNGLFDGRIATEVLSDKDFERCLRGAIRMVAEKNTAFSESLLELDGRPIVMTSTSTDIGNILFASADGTKGENRFGLAMAAERDAMKEFREGRRLAAEQERQRLVDEATKRQKIATGAKAEGQKVVGGLPKSPEQAEGAVWFIGTHNPVEFALPDDSPSFIMWDDMEGEDPLVREKVARNWVDDGNGGRIDNDFVFLFPTDLESFTGRRTVKNMPNSKNLTGVTRVDPETGKPFLAAVGIPVRFDNFGNELINPDNRPCSFRMDNDASNFIASVVVSDCKARSIAIQHGQTLSLPGRYRRDGSKYYTLGQVFMDSMWSKKEQKMVDNPHKSPLNLSMTETYISLLENGSRYPLNCIPMPRGQYFTQDDAVIKQRLSEGQRFVSAEGRFISDLMFSLQLANATALALGVPLRIPLDKDGHIDLGPGVPEEYRMMAEKRIDSFIGVKNEVNDMSGKLPLIERIPIYETGTYRDVLVKAGTDLYIRPNDLAAAFGQFDFSSVVGGVVVPLHEMAFRLEDGTVFSIKDVQSTRSAKAEDVEDYLNYSKNNECRFIIRTTDPEKTPYFIDALKAYADRAKAVKVDVRLVSENETRDEGLEGYVSLLSSNSDQLLKTVREVGREMNILGDAGDARAFVEQLRSHIRQEKAKGHAKTLSLNSEEFAAYVREVGIRMKVFSGSAQADEFIGSFMSYVEREKEKGYVNLLSSNSDEFAESVHDIGREMTVFNASGTVNKEGAFVSRNVDGEDISGPYWGKVDAKDGFKGYVQLRYTLPNGEESGWNTLTDLELAKDTVLFLVNRTYRSDSRVVPAGPVLDIFHKAAAVAMAGSAFRDFAWSPGRQVMVDDKVVVLDHSVRSASGEKEQEPVEPAEAAVPEAAVAGPSGAVVEDSAPEAPAEAPAEQPEMGDAIVFTESEGGYQKRTYENANADDVDFTVAIAVDFTTYGERATAKAAGESLISVEVKDFSDKDVKRGVKTIYEALPEEFQKGEPFGVNFAGNGIYTLDKNGISQGQVNEFMTKVISGLQSKGVVIQCGRSGGQTGIDEAAIVAGAACGIPMTCHAPKGWLFRGADNKDVSGEQAFKERFDKVTIKALQAFVAKPKVLKPKVNKLS